MESDVSVKYWKRRTEIEQIRKKHIDTGIPVEAVCLHEVEGLTVPQVAKR